MFFSGKIRSSMRSEKSDPMLEDIGKPVVKELAKNYKEIDSLDNVEEIVQDTSTTFCNRYAGRLKKMTM